MWLMRSGSKKVDTFALLKESQRDKILLYLNYPELGSKWQLWPGPEANTNKNDTDDDDGWNPERSLKSKQATAVNAKKTEFIYKLDGEKEISKERSNSPLKSRMKDKQRKSTKDDKNGKHTDSRSKKQKCTDDDTNLIR